MEEILAELLRGRGPVVRLYLFALADGNGGIEGTIRSSFAAKDRVGIKLVSVNTGLPRDVTWHNRIVTTGIFKSPIGGRVDLRTLNLDGDQQADLTVHGGEQKAVYCYPLIHYDYWKKELLGRELPMGMFGENFTIDCGADGLLEDSVHLGDRFSVGTAEVVVTQPRLPCYKLGVRFGSDDMVKRFLVSGRTGFYLAVTREGEVGAGDEIKMIARDANAVPVSEITRLYVAKRYGDAEVSVVQRALQVGALPGGWKDYFRERLSRMGL
jgi:MOSC domain-containing protein YiiM